MNELKLYCPKCGKELKDVSDHVKKISLFVCDECRYLLPNPKIIDISFKAKGLAKALSNLCAYPFEFDGVKCTSMEGFIQSLKVQNPRVQEDICSKSGPFCHSIREIHDDWRDTQNVYWKGKEICRHNYEYMSLLIKAYEALVNQSPLYYYALKKVKENGYKLAHTIGCSDPTETLLTPDEFIKILWYLIHNCIE